MFAIKGKLERLKESLLIIPVVYRVVRWDHSSLLIIMEYWLGRMQKTHEKDKYHKDATKHVKQIFTCRNLLKRMYSETYEDSFLDEHDKRWGKLNIWFVPKDEKYSTMHTKRDNIITDEDLKLERREYRKIIEQAKYLYNQDFDFLLKQLKKNLRSWWV